MLSQSPLLVRLLYRPLAPLVPLPTMMYTPRCRLPGLLLRGLLIRAAAVRVFNDLNVGERDQALVNHLVQHGQHASDLLLRIHDRNHDGQVAREVEEARAVHALLRAVAHQPAVDGRAGDVYHAQLLDYRLVQRLALPAVVLADVDAEHLRPAFELLVLHRVRLLRFLLLFRKLNDLRVLHLDKTTLHHLVDPREKGVDLLLGINGLDSHGHVLGEAEEVGLVHLAALAVAGDGTRHGRAGAAVTAEEPHDGLVNRLPVVVPFDVDVDDELLRRASLKHLALSPFHYFLRAPSDHGGLELDQSVLAQHLGDAPGRGLYFLALVHGLNDDGEVFHRHLVHVGVDAPADAETHHALRDGRARDVTFV